MKQITPSKKRMPSRQFRMIQLTLRAIAAATRHTPSTMKNTRVLRRLAILIARKDCTAGRFDCALWNYQDESSEGFAQRIARTAPKGLKSVYAVSTSL